MEAGSGAPAGASGDVGQVSATFEAGFEQGGAEVSSDTSFGQSEEFYGDNIDMSDSHSEQTGEVDLVEGEIVNFGSGEYEPKTSDGENRESENVEEVSRENGIFPEPDTKVVEPDPQMNPDESIEIAKKDGFEQALEYYAHFPSDKADEVQVDREDRVSQDTEFEEIEDPIDTEEETNQEAGDETQEETQEAENQKIESGVSQEDLMQNPEVRNMLELMKNHSEMFKMLIERLEKQQQITGEMLMMMATLLKEVLENKKDKDDDEKSMFDALVSFIGFLMGMFVDPEKESQRMEKSAESHI